MNIKLVKNVRRRKMRVKPGVHLYGLQLPMRKVLTHADKLWTKYGKELVITSTVDGVHSPGSLHPYGYAIDLRTHYFPPSSHTTIAAELQAELGSDYRVIVHETHIHVEYRKVIE